jgi:glucose/arabinose dehydrogenase
MFHRTMTPSRACLIGLLAVGTSASGQAPAPPDSDFQVVTLAKGSDKTGEPMAMAVLPDRRVLHTSRDGQVWLTTPDARTSKAGKIPVYTHDEDGLQGIAIDADFEENRWVYVYYAPPLSTPRGGAPADDDDPSAFEPFEGHNLLSRVKLTDAGTLDLSTEQPILRVPADRGICCHAGGEIDFDAAGNLYLSTGDDTDPFASGGYTPIDERPTRNPAFDAQRTSANTNDLRGKLLRIRVLEDGSYAIPPGNLFPPDTPGTRPEIYAMGFRNPFRFAVDPATGWIFLGDYGPDAGNPDPNRGPGGQVEFNLIRCPGNYGWPYVHGENAAYNDFDFATGASGPKFDPEALVNTSPRNTGLVDLPPARPAWIAYDGGSIPEFGSGSESPMGGETYRFDPDNPSPTKFPAHFHGKIFAYEFGRGWFRALSVGPLGEPAGIEPFLDSFDFKKPINAEFGPDGSLYVLDYGTGNFGGDENSALYRVDHVQGTRGPLAEASADRTSGPTPLVVAFSSEGSVDPDGDPLSFAWDLDGDGSVDSTEASPTSSYDAPGRYTATLTVADASGREAAASVNLVAGNTAPMVTITAPPHGGIFEYGAPFPFAVTVTDPEDGPIDCDRVRIDTALGHNEHSHSDQGLTGCSGQITVPGAWEDKTQHSFYVLTASYTDGGAATPGLELTGSAQIVLEHRTQQAEFFDEQQGTQTVPHQGAEGGNRVGFIQAGDWLRFDDISLSGIVGVVCRVTSVSNSGMEFRVDSPTGPVVASVAVPSTGSFDTYATLPAVPVADPGGTHDLYVVFTDDNMDLDEFTLLGAGVTSVPDPGP